MRYSNNIATFKQIATEKNGICLSDVYINSQTKLKFQCKVGHIWEAIPTAIKGGQWCKKCSDNIRSMRMRAMKFEEAKQYAISKNGKCLTEIYDGPNRPMKWECEYGHHWTTTFESIKPANRWCPHCSNRAKLTIELMQELAHQKGGKCLSKEYLNIDTKLFWQCAHGHQWESKPYLIKNGSWCPKCNVIKRSKAQRSSIDMMALLAKSRGGKCISKDYTNTQTPLIWECNNGHQWSAVPNNIKNGRWCPICSAGLGERICKAFFEQLFNTEFVKTYPFWLISSDGNQMELDGYSDIYKLAFEHQGDQHYSIDGFFNKTKEQLEKRKRNDSIKIDLCKKHDVNLILIPEIPKHLKVGNIKSFIRTECEKLTLLLPENFDQIEVNLFEAYTPEDSLEELKILAKSKGGNCLSDVYIGTQSNMLWQCKEGHIWSALVNAIKRGSWCPICAGTFKLTFDEMKELAKAHNGKCLSEKYVNNNTALLWKCKEGHIFKATPDKVKQRGQWCPKCGIKKRADAQRSDLWEMQKIADKRNGKCVSTEYINTDYKLTWECKYGHQWEAIPDAVKRGSWCPVCAGLAKLTIEEMQKLANLKGGKCLSEKYVNVSTKLLWECKKGHQWEAIPNGIKRGAWCPVCSGHIKLTIEDMQKLASSKGGKCLSEKYINIDTKLLWECKYGHQWKTIPYLIRKGSWCPTCCHENRKKQ